MAPEVPVQTAVSRYDIIIQPLQTDHLHSFRQDYLVPSLIASGDRLERVHHGAVLSPPPPFYSLLLHSGTSTCLLGYVRR